MQNRPKSYLISEAMFKSESEQEWRIAPASRPWLTTLVSGGFFVILGVLLMMRGGSSFLLGLMPLSLAVFFITTNPVGIELTFDFANGQVKLMADYWLRSPNHIDLQAPFSQIGKLGFRPNLFGRPGIVDINLADGTHIILNFNTRRTEAKKLVDRFATLAGTEAAPTLNSTETVKAADVSVAQSEMQRGLQSWRLWLIVMGVAEMIAANGFSTWGTLLIAIGLASFYFRESPMFLIYALTIAWAGLSNLLYSSSITWKIFAFIQFFLAFTIFRQFLRFQRAERDAALETQSSTGRAAASFPWLALGLGLASLVCYGTMFFLILANGMIHFYTTHQDLGWTIINVLGTVSLYAALLGLAAGLAGWIAAYPRRWASILGTLAAAATLTISILFSLIDKL